MSELYIENTLQNSRDEKVLSLQYRVSDLEVNTRFCSSKDCIIIENASLNPNSDQMDLQVCDFSKRYLSYSARIHRISRPVISYNLEEIITIRSYYNILS